MACKTRRKLIWGETVDGRLSLNRVIKKGENSNLLQRILALTGVSRGGGEGSKDNAMSTTGGKGERLLS